MGIKVGVKWKVKVNRKEYGSVEDMPSHVREAYEKAKGTPRTTAARIVFNGQEYQSVEAMPPDLRQVYEKVMKGAATGEIPSDVLSGAEFGGTTPGQGGKSVVQTFDTPRPIEPESTLSHSPRMLIVGLALLIVLMGLYYLITR